MPHQVKFKNIPSKTHPKQSTASKKSNLCVRECSQCLHQKGILVKQL